jgi:copper chaperone
MNLVDIVLILIIAAILFFALKGTMKHFNGESSCCGGSVSDKVKVDDKNLSHYPYNVTIETQGLKCEGCKTKVENALNSKIDVYAVADYKKNIVKVHMKNNLDDAELKKAIEDAGYKVVKINR